MKCSSPILQDLIERGFIYQCTDIKALDDLFCSKKNVAFYLGFDPTGQSLHAGHLMWIKLVNKLQKIGWKPIILAGGATGIIGDPSGKDSLRKMLSNDEIEKSIESIMVKLSQLIDFELGENLARLVNNINWLGEINYINFLRDFGSLVSVNKMLSMDSVKNRLEREQHLSFLEFNYMLLQAYDFLYLFENYDCFVQIGGSDQWSNMISGVDLIRKKTDKLAIGVSIPLLTNSAGEKMGKTVNGAVWIDERFTSEFDFWQYWRNVDDADVCKLMKLFTELESKEINSYKELVGTSDINDKKIILANIITNLVHQQADTESIKEIAISLRYGEVKDNELKVQNIETPMDICATLVKARMTTSKSEAKKIVKGKGVKIDGIVIENTNYIIKNDCVLSVGKKNFVKIKITD